MIDETVEEIEQMQTHSSSVVAVKAATALRELTEGEYPTVEEFVVTLERNANALKRANPSHASLHNAQRDIVTAVKEAEPGSVPEAQDALAEAIDRVVDRIENAKGEAARNGAELFADDTTVLTHDYSSTVLEAVERAAGEGKQLEVYVTEARPRYLGRKSARALADIDGVEPHLIVDGAAGHFLEDCDRVVTGMSCIVDGTLYNRIGTYPIAAAAADVGVPTTVIGSGAKIIEGGFAFENDIRPPSEVMREPAEGFTVENPAYDATPTRLLDTVVTDEGVREF
ncbi:MAG: translation initiation factor eIF-2B [Halorientalis sp.]